MALPHAYFFGYPILASTSLVTVKLGIHICMKEVTVGGIYILNDMMIATMMKMMDCRQNVQQI